MKYKLIKRYPGYDNVGLITWFGPNNLVHPENYPEFWELVVEKDYEILSVLLQRSDKHQIQDVSEYNTSYIEALINCNGNKIHSVKRNDGEIFTIGDKVIDGNIINEFELIDNKLKVWTVHTSYTIPIKPKDNGSITGCGNMSFNWLNNIKKFKQKLFTSEDGVDIFEGDKYWCAHNENFGVISMKWTVNNTPYIATNNIIYDYNTIEGKQKLHQHGNFFFSTKEKAEEYILMNKPVLSLNDYYSLFNEDIRDYGIGEKLKKLVKSKIQQSV